MLLREEGRDAALKCLGVTIEGGQGQQDDPDGLYELYGAILENEPVTGPGHYLHLSRGRVVEVERPHVVLDHLADRSEARARGEPVTVDKTDPLGCRAAGLLSEATEQLDEVTPKAALRLVAKLVEKSERSVWNKLKLIYHRRKNDGRPTYELPPEPR